MSLLAKISIEDRCIEIHKDEDECLTLIDSDDVASYRVRLRKPSMMAKEDAHLREMMAAEKLADKKHHSVFKFGVGVFLVLFGILMVVVAEIR